MKGIIVVCPKCEMRVIPKADGTCPSCHLNISRVEPIEITRQPVRIPRKHVEEELTWDKTGDFEGTPQRRKLRELFESAQHNLIMKYVGIIWRRLLLVTLIISPIVAFFFRPILISREFEAIEYVPVLVIAIFSGLYCLYEQIATRLQEPSPPSRKRKTLLQSVRQQIGVVLPEILEGLIIGVLTYFTLMYVPAKLLHTIAAKEFVQFDVIVTSTGRTNKNLRKDCQYYLQFDDPQISSDMQSVCLNKDQWLELRNASYPTTVHLEGQKSYFGYNLRYTK